MWCRRFLAAVLPLLLLGVLACSKTEDKAAEKRVFGDPPQFKSMPVVKPKPGAAIIPCDVTGGALAWANNRFGDNFTLIDQPMTVTMSEYTEVSMTVEVTDPQGVPDILGVFARYVPANSKNEYVVVLLDDGSHDCSVPPGSTPPAGCFGSPSASGVALLQSCTTEAPEAGKCPAIVDCDFDQTYAGCADRLECADGRCHRRQECIPGSFECLCGAPGSGCDIGNPDSTMAYCFGFSSPLGIGDPCQSSNCTIYFPDSYDPNAPKFACENPADLGQAFCQGTDGTTICSDAFDCSPKLTCKTDKIYVTASDLTQGDGIFTRKFAVANLRTAGVGADLATDCVISQVHQTPILLETADTLEFSIEVVDKSANDTIWPGKFGIKPIQAKFACQGDPCLCCLLEKDVNGEPYVPGGGGGCSGAPGLEGVKFPEGFCKTCVGHPNAIECCSKCDTEPNKPNTAPKICDIKGTNNPTCE